MQRPDEKKRQLIVATAAKMFAARPFHKVRLDDIAAEAHLGKGTLYVYFDNKEDLYISLIYDGFERLVENLRRELSATAADGSLLPAAEALRRAVDALVGFAFAHPHLFEMMRNVGEIKRLHAGEWKAKRQEFMELIANTIRRGVENGELTDQNPEMTAACLGGMVRSIMLFGPRDLGEREVAAQVYRLIGHGIIKRPCGKPQ
ncbi:TetR/AcrR family transcriptional regulator [Humisphaera borealis]|uniref:TetR/AcrR family transcriptional regulator n=1 Tax=Humisphaera borealis TaxID=2807512 RepID=A0A7M2WRW3_9BACT|nr:TetR/AcrR family transcriptional regulator [Humisphaera borealis]QOV87902.1 TetR/AcrR family transcriptional regulator [Humisphaera borealis]